MLWLCLPVLERIRAMPVGGVVGGRGWCRMMVLHANEQDVAAPSELPPDSGCDDFDLDARAMFQAVLLAWYLRYKICVIRALLSLLCDAVRVVGC